MCASRRVLLLEAGEPVLGRIVLHGLVHQRDRLGAAPLVEQPQRLRETFLGVVRVRTEHAADGLVGSVDAVEQVPRRRLVGDGTNPDRSSGDRHRGRCDCPGSAENQPGGPLRQYRSGGNTFRDDASRAGLQTLRERAQTPDRFTFGALHRPVSKLLGPVRRQIIL